MKNKIAPASSNANHETKVPWITRRRFLRHSLQAGLAFGLVGTIHSLSRGGQYVRPPGALPPKSFTSKCMRCSICVEVCPTRAVRLLDLTWDLKNISTPVIDPVFGGCTHWSENCMRCADSCPSGALNAGTGTADDYKIGRVWLKPEACVNCMVCFYRCPVQGAVLFPNPDGAPFTRDVDIPTRLKLVNSSLKPYINTEVCVGCGLCVHYCPQKCMYLEPLGHST